MLDTSNNEVQKKKKKILMYTIGTYLIQWSNLCTINKVE